MEIKALDTNIISYLLNTKVFNIQLLKRFEQELENNVTLVTNNMKHFKNIPDLKLENWVD